MFHLVGKLSGHRACARAVFLRIRKNAEPLKLRLADEIEQRVEARLGLAGKADYESRPQRDARHAGADSFDEVHDILLRGFAAHPFEHVFVNMLERHVHVARDFLAAGDGLDEFIRPVRRMRVEQTDPEIAGQRI